LTLRASIQIIRICTDSQTIIGKLEAAGWRLVGVKGSHYQFRHRDRSNRMTVPHPKKDVPISTIKSIERQSGLKIR
jgi:predicted RNA binding protein YcfA (HicA-like mRNA interferase family)